jgi:putative ABC transport system permease protein
MTMPIALRLAIRQWLARPLRPILCSLAIAAAVALIVAVGSAMDSLRASVRESIGQMLGVADVHVRSAQRGTDARLTTDLLLRLRAMPQVEMAGGRLASQAALTKADEHKWYDVVGIQEPLDNKLRPKQMDSGRTLSGAPDELIIDTIIAHDMNLKLGDDVLWAVKENPPKKLRIVGIAKRPVIEIMAKPTMFVPLGLLTRDLGIPTEYSVLDLKLRELDASGAAPDADAFAKALGKTLGPSVEVTPGTNSKARMAEVTRTLTILLMFLSAMCGLSASLIIGTTLSVGVQERVRQFGQLRCIGASRSQLAAILLGDALVMMLIGVVLGLLAGVGLAMLLVAVLPEFFHIFVLSWTTIILAVCCGAFATGVGAVIPIYQVTRVPPMAAVTAAARPVRRSRIFLAGALGVGFLILQQILWHLPLSRDVRVFTYILLGVHLIFIGWCLLAPTVIIACEKIGARLLGFLFAVRHSLLRHAWSRTPWRSGAMVAALMIGVTIFITVRARGHSVLTSWITPGIPDLVLKTTPWSKFSDRRVERLLREHPDLRDVVTFDYFPVTMKTDASIVTKMMGEEKPLFLAVDIRKFASSVPLDYVQGDPVNALNGIDQGRQVFVTTEFYNVHHRGAGDKLVLLAADGTDVEFTIAAVVNSTGLEMVKNYFDLRAGFDEKSSNALLGTITDARKYFKFGDPTLLLTQVDPAARGRMPALRRSLEEEGMNSMSAVEMKDSLHNIIQRITNALSVIAFGALCVASLGVANMVIASIHARRFEFGVLRAIGAGRWQLVRMVLAEVTLIGLIAGVLGACCGLTYAYMITKVDRELVGFETAFVDPNPARAAAYAAALAALAIALTTVLGWIAALVPAVRGARSAQRVLLASGRG